MLRIKKLGLKFGRNSAAQREVIELTPVTVFVGPNNSGKSLVLREIQTYCAGEHNRLADNRIVEALELTALAPEEATAFIDKFTLDIPQSRNIPPSTVFYGQKKQPVHVDRTQLLAAVLGQRTPAQLCSFYLKYATLAMNGPNRMNLVAPQTMGDLRDEQPSTSFQILFTDDLKRKEVRRVLYEAFDQYLTIDPSSGGQLRLMFSLREPINEVEEQSLNRAALQFYKQATPIEVMSDGVKAFTGIVTEIVAGDPHVLIIDEPEAFLHPPLAFKLGHEVSRLTLGTDKNLFVSTHSSHFVMGCIQSGAPVNIVRLTYRAGIATARILNNSDVFRLMRNPLLRSTGVLNALFYEFVVVTEGDADRAFYQEINERLLRFDPARGIPNCLFLNAQNKQTVRTIIQPLRELGIPAAAIVDVDILKEGGTVWSSFLDQAGFVPEIDRQALAVTRSAILSKFEATGKNMKRDGGIDLLRDSEKEAANNLFDRLADYGLFVLRRGELESWLPNLDIPAGRHGPNWLVDIFEKMGEDPDSPDYLKPGEGDVWEFMSRLKSWLTNSNRKGIPS